MKTIFRTRLTDVDSSAVDTLGDLRYEQDKIYKYVQLQNTSATVAVVATDMVSYDNETGARTNIVVADDDDADAVPIGAGAVQAAAAGTLTVAYYLWIQVTGPITLATPPTSGNDGQSLMMSTSADKTLIVANAVTDTICATANDRTAGEVILRCPF